MPEPTLFIFDGYNVLHAGDFADERELTDSLASFVALRGARGIVVFDGHGMDRTVGPLAVRYAKQADALIERLAAEHRGRERVCLVSSDSAVRGTSGQEVAKVSSKGFVANMLAAGHEEERPSPVADRLDDETRARLERLRRGR
jgi:predicted RNA-binding protein with PIN domain